MKKKFRDEVVRFIKAKHFDENKTAKEIANMLGIEEAQVETIIQGITYHADDSSCQ